jgi:hypothetical protein
MKIFATYLGPKESKYFLMHKDVRTEFPYYEPVEVDKEAAKFLRTLKKYNTDDPRFKITSDNEKD